MKATVHCKNQKHAEDLRQTFVADTKVTYLERAIDSWGVSTIEILYIKGPRLAQQNAIGLEIEHETEKGMVEKVINPILKSLSGKIEDTVFFVFGEGIGYLNGDQVEMPI